MKKVLSPKCLLSQPFSSNAGLPGPKKLKRQIGQLAVQKGQIFKNEKWQNKGIFFSKNCMFR